MGHHQRGKDAVFLGRLGYVGQGACVRLAAVTAAYGAHVAVLAVLVPRQEVHADVFHTQVVVMLEESVDVLTCAGIVGHYPVEPAVVGLGIHHLGGAVIIQRAEIIVCAPDGRIARAVYPQGIVVHSQFQAPGLAFVGQVLQRHGAVMGHVARGVFGQHRDEPVGAYHVVAVRLQVGGDPVDDLVPLVGADVHLLVGHAGLLLVVAIFVHAPVQRRLVGVDFAHLRKFRQFKLRRIVHFYVFGTTRKRQRSQCGRNYVHGSHIILWLFFKVGGNGHVLGVERYDVSALVGDVPLIVGIAGPEYHVGSRHSVLGDGDAFL